jgi:small subunit ribosomal protein S19
MSRSKWKGLFQEQSITRLSKAIISLKVNRLKIWSRASVISAKFIDKVVFVSRGNLFKKVLITRNHVGYKFGEFAATRLHKKKAKKKQKNKK